MLYLLLGSSTCYRTICLMYCYLMDLWKKMRFSMMRVLARISRVDRGCQDCNPGLPDFRFIPHIQAPYHLKKEGSFLPLPFFPFHAMLSFWSHWIFHHLLSWQWACAGGSMVVLTVTWLFSPGHPGLRTGTQGAGAAPSEALWEKEETSCRAHPGLSACK